MKHSKRAAGVCRSCAERHTKGDIVLLVVVTDGLAEALALLPERVMRTARKTAIIVLAALAALTGATNGTMAGGDAAKAPAMGTSADLLTAPTDWRPRCRAVRDGWISRMSCPGGRDSLVGWRAD